MTEPFPYEYTLTIDFLGTYQDADTGERKNALGLILCIKKDKETGKKYGVNFNSGLALDLDETINNIGMSVNNWSRNKGKSIDIIPILKDSEELNRKYNRWLSIDGEKLKIAKRLEVNIL